MKNRADFEWLADGQQEGEWETIARSEKHRWLRAFERVPKRVWITLAVIVVALSSTITLTVRYYYLLALRRMTFQIQGVIDLEAQAFAQGNATLYLAQQDSAAHSWYARQAMRVDPGCTEFESHGKPYPWQEVENDPHNMCRPVLPAEIQDVNLQQDVAWVQVVEGQPPVRRMRFYRRTSRGWKHTAPQDSFWQQPIRVRYGNVFVNYRKRDQTYVAPLEAHIAQLVDEICAVVMHCTALNRLEIDFSSQASAIVFSDPRNELERRGRLVLSSPWLSGIPVEGTFGMPYRDGLRYWVAYGIMTRATSSSSTRELTPLQRAISDEYAAWYDSQDLAHAPTLRRVVEQHGMDVLPNMFFSLKGSHLYSLFLIRWLSLPAYHGSADFFEALLNIEHEALLAGRKDTFMLLQDDDWADEREAFFDQVQRSELQLPVVPIHVKAIQRTDDCVRVTLDPSPVTPGRRSGGTIAKEEPPTQARSQVTYFCLQDWAWKHTPPLD
jgi:hypothetical protein